MVQRTYIFNILGKDKNNSLQARIDVYYLIYVLSRYRRPQKKKNMPKISHYNTVYLLRYTHP